MSRLVPLTAITTAGTGAFLMQPLVARGLLEDGGGSAYTWISATTIFQCALIAGYLLGGLLSRGAGQHCYS